MNEIEIWLSIGALIISAIAIVYTFLESKRNARRNIFTGFDIASQLSLENQFLLKEVHGLSDEFSDDELKSIAYLSLILDNFQNNYAKVFKSKNNYNKLRVECTNGSSNFLNKVLKVKANQVRWEIIKNIYYGNNDINFIEVIDFIIKHENTKKEEIRV